MQRIPDALRPNFWLKVGAFAAALMIWTFSVTQPEIERVLEAEPQYVNVPDGLEIDPDQAHRVTVVIRGVRRKLDEIDAGPLNAELDLSGVSGPGEQTFTVTSASLNLPRGIEFVRAIPSQLHLRLEPRVRREVPVEPSFVGAPDSGYVLDSYTVTPPVLTIVGPRNRLSLLAAVTTDRIDLSGAAGAKSFHAAVFVSDPYVRFEGDAHVTVNVEMRRSP
ncbi:MAG: CdaR family protein [Acidobacteria bacterium]|nr:CdaR family protein [Acidobacteriota bacterium]